MGDQPASSSRPMAWPTGIALGRSRCRRLCSRRSQALWHAAQPRRRPRHPEDPAAPAGLCTPRRCTCAVPGACLMAAALPGRLKMSQGLPARRRPPARTNAGRQAFYWPAGHAPPRPRGLRVCGFLANAGVRGGHPPSHRRKLTGKGTATTRPAGGRCVLWHGKSADHMGATVKEDMQILPHPRQWMRSSEQATCPLFTGA